MKQQDKNNISCLTCECREGTQWEALSPAELKKLDAARTTREYQQGDILFSEGDECKGIYCVLSGLVVVRKYGADGKFIILRRQGQFGTTLGYRPFLADDCYRGTAVVMKPGVICHIESATLKQLFSENPKFGMLFLKQAAIDLGNAEEDYLEQARLTIEKTTGSLGADWTLT